MRFTISREKLQDGLTDVQRAFLRRPPCQSRTFSSRRPERDPLSGTDLDIDR